jgi:integrase
MIQRLGRMPGNGKLRREQRGRDCPPVWVLDYSTARGERKRIALSTDKRVAEMKQREILRQRDMEVMGVDAGRGNESQPHRLDARLDDLLRAYLTDLATRTCPRHALNVRIGLEALLAAIPAKTIGALRPMMLIEYRAKRLAAGVSVRTANLDVDRLRACLTWCAKIDLIATNPIARFPRLKENESTARYRRRAFSEAEITAFLDAVAEDDRQIASEGSLRGRPRVRQLPFWKAVLECGGRYSEMVRACWSDVDLDRRVLHLRAENTKAGRSREIPLLLGLVDELRRLRDDNVHVLGRPLRPSDRMFLTPRGYAWPVATTNLMRVLDRTLEAAGIARVDEQGRKIDVHAMRHCFATRLARSGAPLVQAQQLLGHSDPKLTARVYSHLAVEDLRDAVERLAPIASASGRAQRA